MELQNTNENFENETPLLNAVSKTNPFTVPDQYFDQLSSQLRLKAMVQSEGHTVPDGYFEKLQENITAKTIGQKETKNRVRVLRLNWQSYAVAASVILILAAGLIFKQYNTTQTFENKLASLPDKEIVNYLQVYTDTGDIPIIEDGMQNEKVSFSDDLTLSDQAINEYLESTL